MHYYIPFGQNCTPARLLRTKQLRTQAFPFDWLYVSFPAILELLKTDFKDFLHLENLVADTPVPGGKIYDESEGDILLTKKLVTPVLDKKSQVLFLHDFGHTGLKTFDDTRTKFDTRIKRLLNLFNDPNNSFTFVVNEIVEAPQWKELYAKHNVPFPNIPNDWKQQLHTTLKIKYPKMKFEIKSLQDIQK